MSLFRIAHVIPNYRVLFGHHIFSTSILATSDGLRDTTLKLSRSLYNTFSSHKKSPVISHKTGSI